MKNNCVVCQGRVLHNNLPSAGNRHESRVQCSVCKVHLCVCRDRDCFRLFSGVARTFSLVGHTPWNGALHKLLPILPLSSCTQHPRVVFWHAHSEFFF